MVENEESIEISQVLCQTEYGSIDLAEFTKHRLKGPDTRCSTEIEMYTK